MPEWLGKIVLALTFILFVISIVCGALLSHRYESPYRLRAASSARRWTWALIIAAFYVLIPLTILFGGLASLSQGINRYLVPLFLVYLGVPFFILCALTIRLRLAMIDALHRHYDKSLHHPVRQRIVRHPFFVWLRKIHIAPWDRDRIRFADKGFDKSDDTSHHS